MPRLAGRCPFMWMVLVVHGLPHSSTLSLNGTWEMVEWFVGKWRMSCSTYTTHEAPQQHMHVCTLHPHIPYIFHTYSIHIPYIFHPMPLLTQGLSPEECMLHCQQTFLSTMVAQWSPHPSPHRLHPSMHLVTSMALSTQGLAGLCGVTVMPFPMTSSFGMCCFCMCSVCMCS